MSETTSHTEKNIRVTNAMVKELKQEILEKEKKVLHLRKHGMKDTIIDLIKARIK